MKVRAEGMPRSGVVGWLPEELVKARKAADLSVTELALRVGLSRNAVHAYEKPRERGGSTPTPENFVKLAQELKVPGERLIDFTVAGLAGYRIVQGLSQAELVERMGDPDVDQWVYRNMESGRTAKLRESHIRSLASVFGISEEEVRQAHRYSVARGKAERALKGEGAERTP